MNRNGSIAICEKSGQKEAILQNVTVYGATVKQLALYVAQGVVDAAIIGRADGVQNREKITMVDIPKDLFTPEIIGAAVLQSTPQPELATELCEFFSSPHAIEVFQQYGFLPID